MTGPSDRMPAAMDVVCEGWIDATGTIEGYVFAASQMWRRWTVELLFEGAVMVTLRADGFVESLWRQRRGDGCYGFAFTMPAQCVDGIWEARLANLEQRLFVLDHRQPPAPSRVDTGEVRWSGGLRLSGFVLTEEEGEAVSCLCDGQMIYQGQARGWTHVTRGNRYEAVRALDIHLPKELADGEAKSVHVYGASGTELVGSPVALVAFADDLRDALGNATIIERNSARLRVFERVFPQSLPFDEWEAWSDQWLPPAKGNPELKLAIAIIGADEQRLERTLDGLERQSLGAWIAAAIPSSDGRTFQAQDLRDFLDGGAAGCEAVLFLSNGSALGEGALARMASALLEAPQVSLIYPDVCRRINAHAYEPMAYPAFDYERFLEQGYFADVFIVRANALGGIHTLQALSVFDVILHIVERASRAAGQIIAHLPGPLVRTESLDTSAALARAVAAHLDRRGLRHAIEIHSSDLQPRLHLRRGADTSQMTIIVVSNGDESALEACITSLRTDPTAAQIPLVIATHTQMSLPDGLDEEASELVVCGGEFQRHRLINRALTRVKTGLVLLLDAELRSTSRNWVDELAGRLREEDVGVVAPMTVDPQGHVAHAGYVLGSYYAAGEPFCGAAPDDWVHGDLLHVAHETTSISLRCALVRMAIFAEVGILDECTYPDELRDVDLGLRLHERRWRTLITPHARFLDTQPRRLDIATLAQRHPVALARFRSRWGVHLLNDALYNPILGLDAAPYSSLAWPPRPLIMRTRFQGDRHSDD